MEEMKLVGFVNSDFRTSYGDVVRLTALMGGLAKRGHDVHLISTRPEFHAHNVFKVSGFAVHEVGFKHWWGWYSFVRRSLAAPLMLKEVEKLGADAAYAMMPGFASSEPAMRFAKKRGVPFILDFPDLDRYIKPKMLTKRAMGAAAKVLVTNGVLEKAARRFTEEVVRVPNGVHLADFDHLPNTPHSFNILFLGSIQDVSILEGARDRLRGIEIRTVTDIPHSEVPATIASADVCVETLTDTPYFNAVLPLKVLEYMAAGKPVVAPSLEGIKEVITDNHDGLLYTPGDVTSFVRQIWFLRDSPFERERISRNARETARKYDWELAVDALEGALR